MGGSSVVFLDLLVPDLLFGLHLELDERLHLFLRPWGEPLVLAQEFVLAVPGRPRSALVEEIGDVHLEDRENLEERTSPISKTRALRGRPGTASTNSDRKSTRLNSSHDQISYAV